MTNNERQTLRVGDVIVYDNSETYEIIAIIEATLTCAKLNLKLIAMQYADTNIGTVYNNYNSSALLQNVWQVVKSSVSRRYIYEELADSLKMLEGSDANA